MDRPLLRADVDEVIVNELEHILTGACCVCGYVAELFDRFPDGLDVLHVLRVDSTTQRARSRVSGQASEFDAVDGTRGGSGAEVRG